MSTRLEVRCPACKAPVDCHDGHDPAAVPKPGDVAICWHCWAVSVFDGGPVGLTLRPPTEDEQASITSDPRMRSAPGALAEAYDAHAAVALWRGAS